MSLLLPSAGLHPCLEPGDLGHGPGRREVPVQGGACGAAAEAASSRTTSTAALARRCGCLLTRDAMRGGCRRAPRRQARTWAGSSGPRAGTSSSGQARRPARPLDAARAHIRPAGFAWPATGPGRAGLVAQCDRGTGASRADPAGPTRQRTRPGLTRLVRRAARPRRAKAGGGRGDGWRAPRHARRAPQGRRGRTAPEYVRASPRARPAARQLRRACVRGAVTWRFRAGSFTSRPAPTATRSPSQGVRAPPLPCGRRGGTDSPREGVSPPLRTRRVASRRRGALPPPLPASGVSPGQRAPGAAAGGIRAADARQDSDGPGPRPRGPRSEPGGSLRRGC